MIKNFKREIFTSIKNNTVEFYKESHQNSLINIQSEHILYAFQNNSYQILDYIFNKYRQEAETAIKNDKKSHPFFTDELNFLGKLLLKLQSNNKALLDYERYLSQEIKDTLFNENKTQNLFIAINTIKKPYDFNFIENNKHNIQENDFLLKYKNNPLIDYVSHKIQNISLNSYLRYINIKNLQKNNNLNLILSQADAQMIDYILTKNQIENYINQSSYLDSHFTYFIINPNKDTIKYLINQLYIEDTLELPMHILEKIIKNTIHSNFNEDKIKTILDNIHQPIENILIEECKFYNATNKQNIYNILKHIRETHINNGKGLLSNTLSLYGNNEIKDLMNQNFVISNLLSSPDTDSIKKYILKEINDNQSIIHILDQLSFFKKETIPNDPQINSHIINKISSLNVEDIPLALSFIQNNLPSHSIQLFTQLIAVILHNNLTLPINSKVSLNYLIDNAITSNLPIAIPKQKHTNDSKTFIKYHFNILNKMILNKKENDIINYFSQYVQNCNEVDNYANHIEDVIKNQHIFINILINSIGKDSNKNKDTLNHIFSRIYKYFPENNHLLFFKKIHEALIQDDDKNNHLSILNEIVKIPASASLASKNYLTHLNLFIDVANKNNSYKLVSDTLINTFKILQLNEQHFIYYFSQLKTGHKNYFKKTIFSNLSNTELQTAEENFNIYNLCSNITKQIKDQNNQQALSHPYSDYSFLNTEKFLIIENFINNYYKNSSFLFILLNKKHHSNYSKFLNTFYQHHSNPQPFIVKLINELTSNIQDIKGTAQEANTILMTIITQSINKIDEEPIVKSYNQFLESKPDIKSSQSLFNTLKDSPLILIENKGDTNLKLLDLITSRDPNLLNKDINESINLIDNLVLATQNNTSVDYLHTVSSLLNRILTHKDINPLVRFHLINTDVNAINASDTLCPLIANIMTEQLLLKNNIKTPLPAVKKRL